MVSHSCVSAELLEDTWLWRTPLKLFEGFCGVRIDDDADGTVDFFYVLDERTRGR